MEKNHAGVLVQLICTSIIVSILYAGLKADGLPKWGHLVSPGDVGFLRLPPSASEISFWKDGNYRIAEFTIPEKDFRELFPKFAFTEISEPETVQPKDFTKPETVANRENAPRPTKKITNGLTFRTSQSNGGGYAIIYDRSQARAYFHYTSR